MTELQEKFYNGLKTLEKETGLTVIGCFSDRLYIVPIKEARPYGPNALLLTVGPKGIEKEEGGN